MLSVEHAGEAVYEGRVSFQPSFGFVEKGAVLAYNNELMRVAVAVSQGSFAQEYGVGYGPEWTVTFKKC